MTSSLSSSLTSPLRHLEEFGDSSASHSVFLPGSHSPTPNCDSRDQPPLFPSGYYCRTAWIPHQPWLQVACPSRRWRRTLPPRAHGRQATWRRPPVPRSFSAGRAAASTRTPAKKTTPEKCRARSWVSSPMEKIRTQTAGPQAKTVSRRPTGEYDSRSRAWPAWNGD